MHSQPSATALALSCIASAELCCWVDAGGGNGILTQLERAQIRREDIRDLFVTHAHTDHLLGCVWMMGMAMRKQKGAQEHDRSRGVLLRYPGSCVPGLL